MKNLSKFLHSFPGVALITLLILAIPLIAMQFTNEVNWSVSDFVLMGVLIFITGMLYVLVSRYAPNMLYRGGYLVAIGTTFIMIWANLAVGLIGSGPNLGNLMYVGVIAIVLIGAMLARFKQVSMEAVMYISALSLVVHTAIALFAGLQSLPGSSITEIIGVNGFFIMLYVVGGLLFGHAKQNITAG